MQVAVTAPKLGPSAPTPPAMAVVKPTPAVSPAPTSAAPSADWTESIALVEQFRGQLTYSKALALLLGVKSDEELELLVKFDSQSRRSPYQSATALGVNDRGYLVWSRQWGHRLSMFASQSALEACNKQKAADSCRLVMVNGEFQEKEFMEVAARLGRQTPASVSQGLIKATARGFENASSRI